MEQVLWEQGDFKVTDVDGCSLRISCQEHSIIPLNESSLKKLLNVILIHLGNQPNNGIPADARIVSNGQYGHLLNRDALLGALEVAGVDNWEGYSLAWDIFDGEEG